MCGFWIPRVVLAEYDAVKVVKIPLGLLLNSNIHQGLVNIFGNEPVFIMGVLVSAISISNIMDGYTKIMGLWC